MAGPLISLWRNWRRFTTHCKRVVTASSLRWISPTEIMRHGNGIICRETSANNNWLTGNRRWRAMNRWLCPPITPDRHRSIIRGGILILRWTHSCLNSYGHWQKRRKPPCIPCCSVHFTSHWRNYPGRMTSLSVPRQITATMRKHCHYWGCSLTHWP